MHYLSSAQVFFSRQSLFFIKKKEPECSWYDGCSNYERELIEEEEAKKQVFNLKSWI
jgi:putative component of membrane protein insertase Oxa1/YidC/SpoIIIJ protein YidD